MEGSDDILKVKWQQLRDQARTLWEKLTDDDLDRIAGRREDLRGALSEHYGWTYDEAEADIDRFLHDIEIRI